jgi:hypothetical protein
MKESINNVLDGRSGILLSDDRKLTLCAKSTRKQEISIVSWMINQARNIGQAACERIGIFNHQNLLWRTIL